jgi:hypothetical protein
MGGRLLHTLTRFLARLAAWPLALLILFEEWGWNPLQRALARLARALHLDWVEARIRELPPYAALALFIAPSILLLPVKLLALWLMHGGRVMLGTLVIVAAKIVGTAIVARLFTLTQPALMKLAWFARAYTAWVAWKEMLLAHARESWPWRWARVVRRRWRRAVQHRPG